MYLKIANELKIICDYYNNKTNTEIAKELEMNPKRLLKFKKLMQLPQEFKKKIIFQSCGNFDELYQIAVEKNKSIQKNLIDNYIIKHDSNSKEEDRYHIRFRHQVPEECEECNAKINKIAHYIKNPKKFICAKCYANIYHKEDTHRIRIINDFNYEKFITILENIKKNKNLNEIKNDNIEPKNEIKQPINELDKYINEILLPNIKQIMNTVNQHDQKLKKIENYLNISKFK